MESIYDLEKQLITKQQLLIDIRSNKRALELTLKNKQDEMQMLTDIQSNKCAFELSLKNKQDESQMSSHDSPSDRSQENLKKINRELFVDDREYIYNDTTILGIITPNIEKIKLAKKYIFLGSNISIHATSKKICGISLEDKWKDGTNGKITIVKKNDVTMITCTSQILRGHNWNVIIYY